VHTDSNSQTGEKLDLTELIWAFIDMVDFITTPRVTSFLPTPDPLAETFV
jgi:hypothetical protein